MATKKSKRVAKKAIDGKSAAANDQPKSEPIECDRRFDEAKKLTPDQKDKLLDYLITEVCDDVLERPLCSILREPNFCVDCHRIQVYTKAVIRFTLYAAAPATAPRRGCCGLY